MRPLLCLIVSFTETARNCSLDDKCLKRARANSRLFSTDNPSVDLLDQSSPTIERRKSLEFNPRNPRSITRWLLSVTRFASPRDGLSSYPNFSRVVTRCPWKSALWTGSPFQRSTGDNDCLTPLLRDWRGILKRVPPRPSLLSVARGWTWESPTNRI